MESLELFGREVLPEFMERDEEQQRDKAKRLAPVIDAVLARKPAATIRRCPRPTTSSRPSRVRWPIAPAATSSTSGSTTTRRRPPSAAAASSPTSSAEPLRVVARPSPTLVRVFERLADLETELEKLESQLSELYASGDQQAAAAAGRRHAELKPIVEAYRAYRPTEADLGEAREMLAGETDAEMREYLESEIADEGGARWASSTPSCGSCSCPADPDDGKNVIVEIRGAEGGEEANLWAGDLFHMYERYADAAPVEGRGARPASRPTWAASATSRSWSRATTRGRASSTRRGPHRVQRVPVTESQGRVHTSAATVAVLPEAEEIDVDDRPERSRRSTSTARAARAGSRSTPPTPRCGSRTSRRGSSSPARTRRASSRTRTRRMRILRCRLLEIERERQEAELSSARRSQVKSGGRSEKIRTYNYKENRVTDHRIGLTLHALDQVLAGAARRDHRRARGRRAQPAARDERAMTTWADLAELRDAAERGCRATGVARARAEARWMVERGVGLRRRRAGHGASDEAATDAGDAAPRRHARARARGRAAAVRPRGVGRSAASTSSSTGACSIPRPETEVVAAGRDRRGVAARRAPGRARPVGAAARPRTRSPTSAPVPARSRSRSARELPDAAGLGDRRRATDALAVARREPRGRRLRRDAGAARAGLLVRRAARRAAGRAAPRRVEPAVRRRARGAPTCRPRSPNGSRATRW